MVAFNTEGERVVAGVARKWGNAGGRLAYTDANETHHYENPLNERTRPWLNSRRWNMVAWTAVKHRRWHRRRKRVPFMEDRN